MTISFTHSSKRQSSIRIRSRRAKESSRGEDGEVLVMNKKEGKKCFVGDEKIVCTKMKNEEE